MFEDKDGVLVMGLTSEQAKELATRTRIPPEVEDQAISMYAEGKTDADVHEAFPTWAAGTFRNLRGRRKEQIDDLRRARTVQFSDIAGVRKQARLNDYWDLRTAYMFLFRAHLESCYAVNPVTGEREFVEQLVDARKLKIYSDQVGQANTKIARETGQLVPLPDELAAHVLGVDGKGGLDYEARVQAYQRWEAGAPEREAERARKRAVAEAWDDERRVLHLMQEGKSRRESERTVRLWRDRDGGRFFPDEVMARHWERMRADDYADLVDRLEEFCERWITEDLEGNRLHLDAEGLEQQRAHLKKYWFPDDVAAHARIDDFFDSWRYPDGDGLASPETSEGSEDMQVFRVMPPWPETVQETDQPEIDDGDVQNQDDVDVHIQNSTRNDVDVDGGEVPRGQDWTDLSKIDGPSWG